MIYRFADTAVDTLRAEILRAGETVPLRRKSFDVLVYLLERPRRVITKAELLDAVWGDTVVTEGSLKHCLMEVRAAIGDHERKLIRTVPRRGYILEAPFAKDPLEADNRTAILVAPIESYVVGSDGSHIADGLTEEIIVELSKIRSFRVISRASSMRLKNAGENLRDTARRLGVDFILDGSIHQAGDVLRICLQLCHLDSTDARWSECYSGTVTDLFEAHNEIVRAIVEELAPHVPTTDPTINGRLEDPRAVESYLLARYEMWKFSPEGLQRAERQLKNALNLVGTNARLLAALGHVYTMYSEIGLDQNGEFIGKAAECAEKIFEADADSPRGYALLGMVRFNSGALREAREPLERALASYPANRDTLLMLGYVYALSGLNQRASRLFDDLLEVDPLSPINQCMPGFVALMEGRYTDTLPYYKRFLELDPQNPLANWAWSHVLLRNGRIDEASEVVNRMNKEFAGSALTLLGTATLHGVSGKRDAARKAVTDQLRAAALHNELFSRELTHSLALAGETDEALRWLENTVRIGNVNYPFWAQHNDWVDPIRSSSRFDSIMSDVEQEWQSLA